MSETCLTGAATAQPCAGAMDGHGLPPGDPACASPTALLDRLDRVADHWRTPLGPAGSMAWRGWGQGRPLVLLHGWAGSWRHWARNLPTLSRHHRLLVPDLPGQGDSDLLPDPVTRSDIARAVLQGLDATIGPQGHFALCGFSFGGAVAGMLAAQAESRIEQLLLVAPGGFDIVARPPATVRVRGLPAAERPAAHRHNLQALMFADPRRIDPLALEIQERNTRQLRAQRVAREPRLLQAAIAGLRLTPHFLWGARDNFCGDRIGTYLATARALRPRDAEILLIEGAGHWVAYEAAAEFEAALLRRLA